jgi:hypothetical protein
MLVGKYRLVHRDNRDNNLGEILEIHSQSFGGAVGAPQTDPQKMPKVKKNHIHILSQDDKLVIMFQPTATITEHTTSTAATNTIKVPVTVNNTRSRFVYETELTPYDFTDKRAYLNSQPWTAGTWYDIWSLTIGAQLQIKVGIGLQDVRVDGALNLQKDVTTS